MLHVYPDYYKTFKCIGSRCRHNCCIGWEIDIDPDTDEFYHGVTGDFGDRLNKGISREPECEPHFILGADERCPFLNSSNLCDIIITLGEKHLCTICAEHPRFHNELPGRIESGLGLCCEEAARIILTRSDPTVLELSGDTDIEDDIISIRDRIIAVLQDRSKKIDERIINMLELCGAENSDVDIGEWIAVLPKLEQLDEGWTALLGRLIESYDKLDYDSFDRHMENRQTEYEQLLVYIIYRHFANAPDISYIPARARFALLTYKLIRALGAIIWRDNGEFDTPQMLELARMFSSEIEYSDENLSFIIDKLDF